MGKPKFSRKKYDTPSHPWQEDRIKNENELVKKYGLKNKREIWKAQTALKKYRGQARALLASIRTEDPQAKKESDQLLLHLNRMNILPQNSNLDDVLALETESILGRRLQTITYLKGLSSTPDQARQLISHGHIAIDGKKVTVPGYMVTKQEENKITYTNRSGLNDPMHPARPRSDYKPVTSVKKEPVKQDEKKDTNEKQKTDESKTKEETKTVDDKAKDEKPVEPPKTEDKPVETKEKSEEPAKEETKSEETKPEEKTEEKTNEIVEKPEEKSKTEEKPEPAKKEEKAEVKEEPKTDDKKTEGGD